MLSKGRLYAIGFIQQLAAVARVVVVASNCRLNLLLSRGSSKRGATRRPAGESVSSHCARRSASPRPAHLQLLQDNTLGLSEHGPALTVRLPVAIIFG